MYYIKYKCIIYKYKCNDKIKIIIFLMLKIYYLVSKNT